MEEFGKKSEARSRIMKNRANIPCSKLIKNIRTIHNPDNELAVSLSYWHLAFEVYRYREKYR